MLDNCHDKHAPFNVSVSMN